ncbi:hypothetical protein [Falsiroseomonas sp. CW058]|uniref:hypothetical protein n=1 Tax=Falsiroseomonas sp. CW058 TaxID=3388664 RepID=UPI003D317742
MRLALLLMLCAAGSARAAEQVSHDPRGVHAPGAGCMTPELRAAAFQRIEADLPPTFRQAMHHCLVVAPGRAGPAPGRAGPAPGRARTPPRRT